MNFVLLGFSEHSICQFLLHDYALTTTTRSVLSQSWMALPISFLHSFSLVVKPCWKKWHSSASLYYSKFIDIKLNMALFAIQQCFASF